MEAIDSDLGIPEHYISLSELKEYCQEFSQKCFCGYDCAENLYNYIEEKLNA